MFSMSVIFDFITDQSRLRITTIVTSDWASRATGGHNSWMQRGKKQWRRNEESYEDQAQGCDIKHWNHDW